jgi:membrane protein implicated in regulation of membrane protease activity
MEMTSELMWAVAGLLLITLELLSGTLYLLVFGAAALVGALAAYLGGDFWLQCLMSGVAALLGTFLLRWWRASHPREAAGSNDLDRGQVVLMESWIDRPTGMARVKYRGATWDARIEGEFKDGEVLCIRGQENGVLFVGVNRPHPIAD